MTKLRITYRTSLDGELRAFMMQQLVKYLLYMRGQAPCLYDELLQFVKNGHRQKQQQGNQPIKRRFSVNRGIKKAVQFVEACEKLFRVQLNVIFSLQVKRVALIFGSSMISPREVFLVDFDNVDDSGVMTSSVTALHQLDEKETSFEDSQTLTLPSLPRSREKLMHLCAQKLVRALFTRSMEHFTCALPATKLHIAVLVERQAMHIPGFLPKQQFKLRLPKSRSRTHYLTICSSDDSRKQSQEDDLQHPAAQQTTSDDTSIVIRDTGANSTNVQDDTISSDLGMVWYVLEKPIAGFSEAINTPGGQ
ncbi:unnamed protein product [Peronospora destructor]|uniref:HORMA domain-containing protein n=1 Tax=Peronospora destructor TaxID=86335 RepID=A0AAV0U327_9STRA|nr:unnamed protein product [Peronospora destructor]